MRRGGGRGRTLFIDLKGIKAVARLRLGVRVIVAASRGGVFDPDELFELVTLLDETLWKKGEQDGRPWSWGALADKSEVARNIVLGIWRGMDIDL